MKATKSQLITVVAIVATILVNIAANALPLNGLTTKELSDAIQVFFVPAGYVFSIWGLIYIGLILFGIYQFRLSPKHLKWLEPSYIWFWLSCIANMGWLFLWHYEYVQLSLIAMILILISLIMVYQNLEIGKYKASTITKWSVHIPFSIYLGWISVATIANVTAVLHVIGWDGGPIAPDVWAAIMLVVAGLLAAVMLFRKKDLPFAAVVLWAIFGIWSKFPDESNIVLGSVIAIAVIVLMLLKTVLSYYIKGDSK